MKAQLYILDEGDPGTVIPVLTNDVDSIRDDVGGEDHGGMDETDFARVCAHGEIKQVRSKEDMPFDLWATIPYDGGDVFEDYDCTQLLGMMDSNGDIELH
jgi:hypothetical protein